MIKAAIKRFRDYCRGKGIELPKRNFTIEYVTSIPVRVGLAGSSAIITATMRSLLEFYGVKVEKAILPGARTFRNTSYRYFLSHLSGDHYGGRNAHLAATGIALCQAARIRGCAQYREMAQRMLDWILGLNPFGVSLVNGVGNKNPPEYVFTGFKPRTPLIPGSVMLGIAGDAADRPDLQPGTWHTGEICTPFTVQTMWLASELMTRRQAA